MNFSLFNRFFWCFVAQTRKHNYPQNIILPGKLEHSPDWKTDEKE